MERRCWAWTSNSELFPNTFIILVGRPGIGKTQAIVPVQRIIRKTEQINVPPGDMTRAALTDYLASEAINKKIAMDPNEPPISYRSAFCIAHELGFFIKEHDLDFLSALTNFYDCVGPFFEEARRARNEKVLRIPHPQISLLGGTTPSHLGSTFPAEAFNMGFLARTILVYSGEEIVVDPFVEAPYDRALENALVASLRKIATLRGEFQWTEEARIAIREWIKDGRPPVPDHPRMVNYNTRRTLHLLKLCMIMRAARLGTAPEHALLIELDDVTEAMTALFEVEETLRSIFLEMTGRSDRDIMNDLWHHMWNLYQREKKPLHKMRMIQFLTERAPSHQIPKIIEAMESAGFIARLAGKEEYIPKPQQPK